MTVRRLLILRHGKAQNDMGGGDRERPLSSQGRADITALAQKLAAMKIAPDIVFCSPARRTRETLSLALPGFPAARISFPDTLYNASEHTLRQIVEGAPDDAHAVMVVAHNPGIHNFAAMMTDESDPNADAIIAGYEPGTLTVIELDLAKWRDIAAGVGRVVTLLVP